MTQPPPSGAVLRLYLPPTYPSWSSLPMNPLEGLPGAPGPRDGPRRGTEVLQKEDFQFYCDPCQKGFHSQVRYDEHMLDHIYCAVPGCGFTCRKAKQWKMELHVETLHNRPDAPLLHDVDAYLDQRRNRFPTTEAVQSKVEELFYKASRGEVLPDERRRWMRQHGVLIKKKRSRDESSYISSNAQRLETPVAQEEPERDVVYLHAPQAIPPPADEAPAPPSVRRPKLVPEGPDGRLSKSQKVLLIREKYRESKVVPKFYVCNRCGEKGLHWVADCPKLRDERFHRHNEWGEDHRHAHRRDAEVPSKPIGSMDNDNAKKDEDVDPPVEKQLSNREETTAPEMDNLQNISPRVESMGTTMQFPSDGIDDTEPTEVDARSLTTNEEPKFVKVIQPVAAMRMRGRASGGARGGRREPTRRDNSLFSRLTAHEGVNDKGLVLQALRFFVARDFFQSSN